MQGTRVRALVWEDPMCRGATRPICTPDLVVFLACTNQRLKERLLKRAEQQGRPDDNLKATQRRLMNFKQNAAPLVKYFQEKGLIMTNACSLADDGSAEVVVRMHHVATVPGADSCCITYHPCDLLKVTYLVSDSDARPMQWI
ncbi:hypothetical protein J1605_019294 [Eschrichtius robustus]|uniref:Nucleoside-diphosphate kinase n=1 Tax=Eschrichtius robustus TaxID=9764 RepID=A0AB34HRJ1_ESCRO|nr:hypothetical protein J1605_019294 [Eschrichtius robustus]